MKIFILKTSLIANIYAQMSLLCILIMLVIFYKLCMAKGNEKRNFDLIRLSANMLVILLSDIIFGLAHYGAISLDKFGMNAVNIVYHLFICLLSFQWFLYSEKMQQSRAVSTKWNKVLCSIPMVCIVGVLLVEWKMGLLFYLDANGEYHRGKFYILQLVVSYGYAILTSSKAFIKSFMKKNYAQRVQYRVLASYIIIPILLGFVLSRDTVSPLFSSGLTLGFFLVYCNTQELLISIDLLTQLNNRNAMDRKLADSILHHSKHCDLYLILADIAYFSEINNQFGPQEGDYVLKSVATVIKKIATKYDAFASRYRGDEFLILLESTNDNMVKLVKKDLIVEMKNMKEMLSIEYPFLLKFGCAKYEDAFHSVPEFIAMVYQDCKQDKDIDWQSEDLVKLLTNSRNKKVDAISEDELDKSGLDNKVFEALSQTTKRNYIFVTNLQTNVTRFSSGLIEVLNLPNEYVYDAANEWIKFLHPDDVMAYQIEKDAVFSEKKSAFELRYRILTREGNYTSCTGRGVLIHGSEGEADLFAGTIVNHGISDNVDPVTNLWNVQEFNRNIKDCICMNKSVAVMIIGVNQFEHINATYGYVYGNQVLKKLADQILHISEDKCHVYRLDGAKFGFVTPYIKVYEIEKLYDQIRDFASDKLYIEAQNIPLKLSAGAVVAEDYDGREDSIKSSAAYALNQSKHDKHGELVFFENKAHSKDIETLEQIAVIQQCVKKQCEGFFLCYQPIVDAKTGKIEGAEALLRWEDEKYGMVPPDSFVPWLEEDPCIYELGNWIIQKAISDASEFKKFIPNFFININIAASQLENPNFRNSVLEMLRKSAFPKNDVWLELTERCKNLDYEFLQQEIDFFKMNGIKVALDDFGTGSSSLSLILDLPIAEIKIDKSFSNNVETRAINQALIEAVLLCTNKMGIRSCIEGIETKEMADFLQMYQANYYQGYYYSKPLRKDSFFKLIQAQM